MSTRRKAAIAIGVVAALLFLAITWVRAQPWPPIGPGDVAGRFAGPLDVEAKAVLASEGTAEDIAPCLKPYGWMWRNVKCIRLREPPHLPDCTVGLFYDNACYAVEIDARLLRDKGVAHLLFNRTKRVCAYEKTREGGTISIHLDFGCEKTWPGYKLLERSTPTICIVPLGPDEDRSRATVIALRDGRQIRTAWCDKVAAMMPDMDAADAVTALLRAAAAGSAARLGARDGFNADAAAHIRAVDSLVLVDAHEPLDRQTFQTEMAALELSMNRAAEAAMPGAETALEANLDRWIANARGILDGADNAATEYARTTLTYDLRDMRPRLRDSVNIQLQRVGAFDALEKAVNKNGHAFNPTLKESLADFVTEEALETFLREMAVEEAAIRKDPSKRTSAVLKRAFAPKAGDASPSPTPPSGH